MTLDSDDYDTDGHSIWRNLRTEPQFDADPFSINQIGHPYQGSIYYGLARSAGLSYWESDVNTGGLTHNPNNRREAPTST